MSCLVKHCLYCFYATDPIREGRRSTQRHLCKITLNGRRFPTANKSTLNADVIMHECGRYMYVLNRPANPPCSSVFLTEFDPQYGNTALIILLRNRSSQNTPPFLAYIWCHLPNRKVAPYTIWSSGVESPDTKHWNAAKRRDAWQFAETTLTFAEKTYLANLKAAIFSVSMKLKTLSLPARLLTILLLGSSKDWQF